MYDLDKCVISADAMAMGIALARALLPHADYAYNPLGLKAFDDARRIKEWIVRYSRDTFELRDASQATGINKMKALPALDVLERYHIIRQIMTKNGSIHCVVKPQSLSADAPLYASPSSRNCPV